MILPSTVTFPVHRSNRSIKTLALAAIAAIAAQSAQAATNTFTATTAGAAWTTGGNWSATTVPTSSDDVLINAGGNSISLSGAPQTIQYLTFTGSTSRTLQNGVSGSTSLTLSGTDGSGNLINVNTGANSPTFTIQNGSGTLGLVLGAGGNINVNGNTDGGAGLTISSNITESGTRALVKTGNGQLTLGGTNSYTGGTTVRGGYINVSSTTALPSTGAITIGDNTVSAVTNTARLTFDTGSSGTYSNDISFVRNGQTQGKVILVRNSAGNVVLNGNITITNNVDFQATATNTLTLAGKVTGSSSGVVLGLQSQPGTVVLSNENNDFDTSTNSMAVTRGTLVLGGNASTVGSAGVLGKGTGALNLAGGNNANENAQVLTSGAFSIARNIGLNQGSASTFNTLGGNTADTSTFSGSITIASGANTTNQLTAATNGTVNLTGAITGTASNGLNKIGNGTVVLGGAGSNTYTGATLVSAGALTAAKATALGGTTEGTTVSDGAALQLFGGIAIGAEALSLTGTGISSGGALRNLSGTNSYAGVVTLAGATRINSDAGTLTIGAGGITGTQNLTFGGAGNTTVSGIISTSTGTVTMDGAGTLTLSGINTYTGSTTISSGTLVLTSGGAGTPVLASSSAIVNNGTLAFDAQTFNVTYTNVISGTGSVTHTASPAGRRVSLTSTSNSYSGGTFVSNNSLIAVTADTNLGNSSGALNLGSGSTGGMLRIDASGFNSATRAITLSGTGTGANSNILAINAANGTASFGGQISGSGNLSLNGAAGSSGYANSGTGALTYTLSGNNIYTGSTTINDGVTVKAGSSTALGNNSAVTLAGTGGTTALDLNGNDLAIGSLAGAASNSGNVVLGSKTLTTGGNNTSTTYAAAITGTGGSLTKTGSGTLILSGTNTYTGTTTVGNGTLALGSSGIIGSSAIDVQTGANFDVSAVSGFAIGSSQTLKGNGTVLGSLIVNGTLAPGASIGTINTNTLSLGSTSHLDIELGRTVSGAGTLSNDRVNVTGGVSLASGADLKLSLALGQFNPIGGDVLYMVINDSVDAVSGVFTQLNGVGTTLNEGSQFSFNSVTYQITYQADFGVGFTGGNDIALLAVPEPGTWAMVASGFGLLLSFQRMRRRNR